MNKFLADYGQFSDNAPALRKILTMKSRLSYGFKKTLTGAGERNRTSDLRFTKPLLYRLSYAGGNENAHPASPAFPPDPRVSI